MKTMKCPKDGSILANGKINKVNIDYCQECMGAWFESDELRQTKDNSDKYFQWLDFDVATNSEDKFDKKLKSDRECPECSEQMQQLEYAQSKVVIDSCPNSHGEWLDDSEFKKIVKYLDNIVLTMPMTEYIKASASELKELITGDEGIKSETKDFLIVTKLLEFRAAADNPELAEKYSNYSTYFRI